ncbi:MAG: hypothetical protein ACRDMZ_06685, partial [Solirubrobacteraceae bacterium]
MLASCASVCTSARDCVIVAETLENDERATAPASTSSATSTPNPSQSRPRMVLSLAFVSVLI